MTKTEELLVGAGLTATEARVYLAGAGAGGVTAQEIARETGIRRPTVYHCLGTLSEKGLVSSRRAGGRLRFSALPPEHLRALVERRKADAERQARSLDELVALLASAKGRSGPIVSRHPGLDGMKAVLDVAFCAKSKHWDIVAPVKNFLRSEDGEYARRYLEARKRHGITSRTLWEFPRKGARELSPIEVKDRNPRFMPPSMQGKFKSMMILFDDRVAIFSSAEDPGAVLITSEEISGMFRAMFEGVWEVSERY